MFRKKDNQNEAPAKRFNFVKIGGVVLGVVAVFYLGMAFGQGKIVFGRYMGFVKSASTGLPANLDYSAIEQLYDSLRASYDGQLDVNELLDGLKAGLAGAAGDVYTEYLSSNDAEEFEQELNGSFTGIGAELGKNEDGNLIIVSPISGFPAEKAGLRPRDLIAQINSESTAGISVSEAVNKIRGPKDTAVKLKIIRGGKEEIDFEITRDVINLPSVESEILPEGIGYIKISRFSEDTSALAKKAAESFKKEGVKAVILDVRGDPGGLLDAAVDVSSLWLDNKTVLTERRGDTVIKTLKSKGTALLEGMPTVVLIDEGSASASEIVAGALRDNNAATLIGAKSFGKGSVQQLINLSGGAKLKVTIARWYTPAGKNIDKEGIEPDQTVERGPEEATNGQDSQKAAAIQFLNR